ncbi:DsbC family protein [Halomonas aquamarina]|uniref:DsbC family protein n=1 Tax=Vreelandella aquamarina TaxID=77097 RepID=A0ACC5VTE3_9GAMM|nr:DsbC family protein [Halomonas aquamarina]MBZ5486994.1 DsbC family protein [Halomonas aquamarina]
MLNIIREVEERMRQRTVTPALRSALLTLAVASILPFAAQADTTADQLRESLSVNGRSMPVEQVSATPMEGIYHVRLESGESFYSNADGSHFLVGDLFENTSTGLVNLTEQAKNQERVAALANVPESERVVYRGVDEPKATVVVFTDPTCPYCERLHEAVPELNERGIAVHYLAFPRAGIESDAARSMQQAWCSDNRSEAMTRAQQRQPLSGPADCDNPVAEQYNLGMALGVQGTPAIILPDGQLVPGYVPPERLAAMLGLGDA